MLPVTTYGYANSAAHPGTQRYVWGPVVDVLRQRCPKPAKVMDLGCGNGSGAQMLHEHGWDVTGVDIAEDGIAIAQTEFPKVRFDVGSVYDDLAAQYGRFPAVISLEVVEHLYDPARYAEVMYDLLEDGGTAVLSTPYHGYLKHLALAVAGHTDAHFNPLELGGHIKFWSITTIHALLTQAGFRNLEFQRVGRIPPLAMSMVVTATRPR